MNILHHSQGSTPIVFAALVVVNLVSAFLIDENPWLIAANLIAAFLALAAILDCALYEDGL